MVYASLRDKIRAEAAERSHRYAKFAQLWRDALVAGKAAGDAAVPEPMIVTNGAIKINGRALDPFKPDSAIVEVVRDGVCGFAWVVLRDGRSSFARWAVANKDARKEYGGGLCLYWVGEYNQSMTRKEAFAHAFAETLRAGGIDAVARSRMD